MKKIITLCLATNFLFLPVLIAKEVALTLDEAVVIALRDNRDILLSAEAIEKAKWKIKEAWTEILPTLDFSIDRDTTQELRDKPYTSTLIDASLKQVIFKSGKIINTIKQNEYKRDVEVALRDKTKLDLVFQVKKSFCTLVLANYFADLNKKILRNTEQHYATIEARYGKGEVSENELLNVKASLDSAKKNCEASLNQAKTSEAQLRNLLFMKDSVSIKPEAKFFYEPREVIYDKALLNAMAKRPEIKQYEAQEKADKKAINIAKAGNMPEIYATWDSYGGDRFVTATAVGSSKWKNYNVYGFTLTWPLFDGFSTKTKIEQAIVDLKQTQLLRERTVGDIALELKNAYLALKTAVGGIEAAESDANFYKNNLYTLKKRYKQGIASVIDLSDAYLKYKVSLFNREQVLYDYIIAKSSLDKAEGSM
ncbi:MAG: TolC family protein [Candidatus Omnitrophota bacterium]